MNQSVHQIEPQYVAPAFSTTARRFVSLLMPPVIAVAAIAFIGALTLGVFA